MRSVKTLIDLARATCGTDAELARRLETSQANVTNMRKGSRPISPETAAMLCDLLELPGEEAREWIALAVIENPKNAGKMEMLRRALFACWAIGVVSLATHQNDAEARTGLQMANIASREITTDRYDQDTTVMHIVAHWLGSAARWLQRAGRQLVAMVSPVGYPSLL